MSTALRLTQQEVDPIGGVAAAPLVLIGSILSAATSIGLTAWHWSEVGSPVAAFAGILFVVAAGAVATVSALPARAPFTVDRLWFAVALAVGAAIAEYVSTVGANRYLYDDYGPLVVGVLILSLAPFSTWISLLAAGTVAAAVLAILAIGSAGASATQANAAALIAVNSVAVLALSAAGAAYSATIVRESLAWQREANAIALERDGGVRAGIVRSVQQGRVSVLSREVLPFLAAVMSAERISVADADRARELAEMLRRALKAGIESTWLDDLASSIGAARQVPIAVDDPAATAARLRSEQRPPLTALLSWLSSAERSESIRIAVAAEGGGEIVRIDVVAAAGSASPSRREVERFLAVARAVGVRGDLEITRENVRVEFRYDA
ncbi:hypothetical protein GCM10017608_29250 [Agromyces luteolus]|uniref:Uncharacterized protein n=1 Tax=Agromyces luteolus TaxID=88373 RepID=A0A7C9LC00_9MICO|nr:hypothetical protein [Agromyces luteolus]MUN06052.1 hypothetical protein [Agromyces luteolus]GLK28990.1 hypothetical protein GCM10017608_29250 [Agromyces luteolus]